MTAPIAVSCGDPAGIGPEIAAKAWAALKNDMCFVWIGDPGHLPQGTPFTELDAIGAAPEVMPTALPVLPHWFPKPVRPGHPDTGNAQGVIDVIARGVELVRAGDASALCTAPISKKVLIDGAGFAFPGHTEYLQALTGAPRAVMMLASPQLRVVPATIHIPLEAVAAALTPEVLETTIRITIDSLRTWFGLPNPRVSVAGLNPHAGESGAMGRQEIEWIAPLIRRLAGEGLDVSGPYPADTLFHAAARANYDAAIGMYHDQALIPIKTIDFDRGVNVTLGLPIIRTSPDHGTAFDIAGRNCANPTSMFEALRLAWRLARRGQG